MPSCRPNRATGTRALISLQEESCWGELAVTGGSAYGLEYTTETLRNDINTIESQLIRSDRMRAPTQQGNHRPGGDVNGELQPHGPWPLLLKHALGGTPIDSGSNPYQHQLQGSVNLPQGLTFEKRFGFPDGTTFKRLRYLGSKVNEFAISASTEGIVTARVGILAREEAEPTSDMDPTPTYPTQNEPFNSFQASVLMDTGSGTRLPIATLMSWDMLINNNIDGDQFALDGLKFRADLPEDIRIINGNMVAFFTSENYALYQAYKNDSLLSMEVSFSRAQYTWRITIPSFKVRGNATPQVGGRGPLNLQLTWEGNRDETLGTDILVSIWNKDAVIAAL